MRVKSAPGSAAANRSHTDAVTAPIDAGPPRSVDRAQVELHVLGHQRVGEARRVATGQHVVRGTCRSWPRSGRSRRSAPRAWWPCRGPPTTPNAIGLAGGGERGRREEVVGQLHRLREAGPVADPVATVAQPGEHRLDVRAGVVARRRTSPRACGPGRRRPRPTPARRRRRCRRRRAARRWPAPRARRWSTCRRRAWCGGRRRRGSRAPPAPTPRRRAG